MTRAALFLVLALAVNAAVFERGRTLLMCHRTANRDVPENTLESIEESARLGCDIVELDVARTLDGKLVLLHDGPIDRITTGSGEVEKILADELALYDAGAWMNPRFAGMQAPSLEDALRTARKLGLRLVLDFKSAGIGPQVLALLRQERMQDRVRFGGLWDDVNSLLPGANSEQTALWNPGMTRAAVAELQSQDKFVIANFSANDHELDLWMMKQAVAAGVDVLNVDYPRIAADALGRPIERTVAALVEKARQGDLAVIAALSRYRDFNLTAQFLELLGSDAPPVSRAAAVALVYARRPESAKALRLRLNDKKSRVAANAAWALGMLGADTSAPDLLHLVSASSSPEARFEALLALSRLKGPVHPRAIEKCLTDPDPLVAGAAALAAARHSGLRAAAMLQTAANHIRSKMEAFRIEYPFQPGIMPSPDILERSLALYRGYQKTVAAMAVIGGAPLENEAVRTTSDISDVGPVVASYQLWTQPGSLPVLLNALESRDAGTRNRAKWTLVKLDGADAALRAAFERSDANARGDLAEILAWRGDRQAIPLLARAASQPGKLGDICRWAMQKLKEFPEP